MDQIMICSAELHAVTCPTRDKPYLPEIVNKWLEQMKGKIVVVSIQTNVTGNPSAGGHVLVTIHYKLKE